MDDASDALEAFEAQLFQIDDDECLSDNDDQRELEELLYASTHYSSHLDGDQDDSCKNRGEDDKHKENYTDDEKDVKIKELNVGTPGSARRTSSRTKRYYDTEVAKSGGVCYNCKSGDHTSKNCPKAVANKVQCFRCEGTGHFARDCPKSKCCYSCGLDGHVSRFCPIRKTSNVSKSDSNEKDLNDICYKCKSSGHMSENCPEGAASKVQCFRCDKTGHFAKDCPKSPCCYTCGKAGHLSSLCPDKESCKSSMSYSNENVPNVVCYNCKSSGHISKNCPKAGGSQVKCFRCEKTGHYARDCPIKAASSNTQRFRKAASSNTQCFSCEETGHYAKDCPKSECYTCGNVGHLSRFCPDRDSSKPSKSDSNENHTNDICSNCKTSTHTGKNCDNCDKEILDLTSEVLANKKLYSTKTKCSPSQDVIDVSSDMLGNETIGDGDHCKGRAGGRRKKVGMKSDSKVSKSTSGANLVTIVDDSGNTNGTTGIIKRLRTKIKSAFKINVDLGIGEGKCTETIENKKVKKKKKKKSSIEGDLSIETSIVPWRIETIGNQSTDCNQETPQYAKGKALVINDKIPMQKDKKKKSKLKAKKLVLDHETLNNLRNILSDSGDEKERCDSAAVFEGNLSVPDINVDTSNPENECMPFDESNIPATYQSGYSTIDRGNNVIVDATHYNPAEICLEDLQAYGVTNATNTSTPKTYHDKLENREKRKRKRLKKRSAEGYPPVAQKKLKTEVLKNSKPTQAMLKKNVTGNVDSYYPNGTKTGNKCNFSKNSEGRTSFHVKKERKENGFLFKNVKKKEVILIE